MFPNLTVWFCPAPAALNSPLPRPYSHHAGCGHLPNPSAQGRKCFLSPCPLGEFTALSAGPRASCGGLPITLSVGLPLPCG